MLGDQDHMESPRSEKPGAVARWLDRPVPRWLAFLLFTLGGIIAGILALAFFLAGEIYDYQDTVDGVHLPPVDAIVCLAGGRGRIAAAGDVWYRYWELSRAIIREAGNDPVPPKPPLFYVSGMGHQANWAVFASQVRRGVKAVIRPEDVALETESENTDANARWLAHYGYPRNWERILLITSTYHMKRARFIFEKELREAAPEGKRPISVETLSVYQDPFEPDEWRTALHGIRVTLLEYFKWIYYKNWWARKE